MKVSLIISVYKNTEALGVVLSALRYQTFTDFEIVISEDGNDSRMKEFIGSLNTLQPLIHVTQPDEGWRKNKALNNAIRSSHGNYLIFIDGDCVLHHRFMEEHKRLSQENGIVAGKRVKLGPEFTKQFLTRKDFLAMENEVATRLSKLKKDGAEFIEEGIYIDPKSLLGFVPELRPMKRLKGCNMSFYRSAIEAINGFDEDYDLPAVGEDADLQWRFERAGYKLISARNLAIQYHLYHAENWSDQAANLHALQFKMHQDQFVCLNGITKLQKS